MANITITEHFKWCRQKLCIKKFLKKFLISFRVLLSVTMWTLSIILNWRKWLAYTLTLLNGAWPETGRWLKMRKFGWRTLLPGQGWTGVLGSWAQGLSHTGSSVSFPGPGWKMLPEMLLCVWKEQREITGFIFGLIAFDSGFMVKTDSRNPHNCHRIRLSDPFPGCLLWENCSTCLKRISTLPESKLQMGPVALLQKNVPVFFPSNCLRGS